MNNVSFVSVSVLVLALMGCGGSSGPEAQPVSLSTSLLQGIWRSPVGATSTMSAVALPNGVWWALVSNASSTRMIKATLTGQAQGFVGNGTSFTLGNAAIVSLGMNASVVAGSSFSGILGTGAQAENFHTTYQTRYASAAQLTDFAGNWGEVVGPGTINWSISDLGAITGTRTTGCTYSGALSLRAERKAVVDVAVSEDCAGTTKLLSGIAVKSEDQSAITMLLTNQGDTEAVALNLTR